jgi:hypothetical protein
LLRFGNEAEREFAGQLTPAQTLGIFEIGLLAAWRTVAPRLGQVQRKVPFQRVPDWFPVLRRRFHHHLFDLPLLEPSQQMGQFRCGGAKFAPLHLLRAWLYHDHHNHPFVNVDSCYCFSRLFLGVEAEGTVMVGNAPFRAAASPRRVLPRTLILLSPVPRAILPHGFH